MMTRSETLVMVVGLAVTLSKVSFAHKDVPLLLRSLQHQNCIATIPLICKKSSLSKGRGDNRETLCFPSLLQLVPLYQYSALFSLTVTGQVCCPGQNNPFIPGIEQEEGKA